MTPAPAAVVRRFFSCTVSPKFAGDEATSRQAQRIAAFVLAMLIWVPVYVTIFKLLNAPLSSCFVLWAGAVLAVVLVLLRSGFAPAICGNLFVGVAWTTYTDLALANGGVLGPSAMWYASIPLMSLWLLGTRAGVFWTLASLGAITGLALAQWYNVPIPNELTPGGMQILHFTALLGIVCCVFILVAVLRKAENHARAVLGDALARAEGADRAKSEFLTNMSHEIRTPMTAILGFAEVLAGDETSAEAPISRGEALATIRRNGEHLLAIIGEILDLSKIEAGKATVEAVDCSPAELARDVTTLIRPRAEQKQLSLKLDLREPLPAMIRTDPTRLKQILLNILGNAVKFTESGTVQLTASCREQQIEFAVTDTGIGMTEEQIARIFQPFTQADASTARRFGGTGLGLAISKRLAAILGGDVVVTSRPNAGSTFRVTIDAGAPADAAASHSCAAAPGASPANLCQDDQPLDCRILLAEDGPDNQRLIAFLLTKAGARVTIVNDGEAAVRETLAAQQAGRPYDLLLVDIQMPLVDGYEATARLRDAGCKLPIVALTAHANRGDRERCLEAGCDDYATKPIDRRRLLATVARHTAGRSKPALDPSLRAETSRGQESAGAD